jgi:transglutaminase-like putative cysteine protease
MNRLLIILAFTVAICFFAVCACAAVPDTPVITAEPEQTVNTGHDNQETKVIQQGQPATLAYINARIYTVKRTFSIINGDAAVSVLRVWLPSITDWESQKIVSTQTANLAPTSSQVDSFTGTSEDFWEFKSKPARNSSLSFTQQYTVKAFQVKLNTEDPVTVEYNRSNPEYAKYIRADKLIEADNQAIINIARKLAGNESSPYRIARLYYEYVNDYMNYQPIDGIGGALFALKNGYGECGDYAALFVALCRASGIPARPVVGRWAMPENGSYHVWAEFYLQDVGWVPVDPSFGPKNNADTFGNLDNNLIIFNKAYDISLVPKPQWISQSADLFQTYYWEFWCGSGNSKSVTVDLVYDSYDTK